MKLASNSPDINVAPAPEQPSRPLKSATSPSFLAKRSHRLMSAKVTRAQTAILSTAKTS